MNTDPKDEENIKKSGCLPVAAGCLVSIVLLPVCLYTIGWISFAVSMSCAFPNNCSEPDRFNKGVLSIVLLGGVVGIPIASGIFVSRLLMNNGKKD